MKKYYILRADGSSIFELPYPAEFVYHCLINLIDRTPNEKYMLCEIDSRRQELFSMSAYIRKYTQYKNLGRVALLAPEEQTTAKN